MSESINERFAREVAELAAQVDPTEAGEWLSMPTRPPFCGALIGSTPGGTGCRYCKPATCGWEDWRNMDKVEA